MTSQLLTKSLKAPGNKYQATLFLAHTALETTFSREALWVATHLRGKGGKAAWCGHESAVPEPPLVAQGRGGRLCSAAATRQLRHQLTVVLRDDQHNS